MTRLSRAARPLLALMLAAVLTGCFQTKAVVRLNADGSGTVEETVLMNSMMSMGFMEEILEEASDGSPYELADDGPYSLEALRERAERMGATLQGVEGSDVLFGSGYTATYAFDDVNDLRLSGNTFGEVMGAMDGGTMGGMMNASGDEGPITFAFSRGQLTVRMPEPQQDDTFWGDGEIIEEPYDDDEIIEDVFVDERPVGEMEDVIGDGEIIDEIEIDFAAPVQPPTSDPKKNPAYDDYGYNDYDAGSSAADEMRAMAAVFKDMRMTIEIILPGDVRETTAQHVEGRTLTLMDMDFGVFAENPEAFEQLEAMDSMMSGPPSMGLGGMGMMQNIPGFRIETEREVTVSF